MDFPWRPWSSLFEDLPVNIPLIVCRLIVVIAQAWESGLSFGQIPLRLHVTQVPRRARLFAGRVGGAGGSASKLRRWCGARREEHRIGEYRQVGEGTVGIAEGTICGFSVIPCSKLDVLSVRRSCRYGYYGPSQIMLHSFLGSVKSHNQSGRDAIELMFGACLDLFLIAV